MKWLIIILVFVWSSYAIYLLNTKRITAECKDGTVSYSKHKSGTCSRHGGVSKWR